MATLGHRRGNVTPSVLFTNYSQARGLRRLVLLELAVFLDRGEDPSIAEIMQRTGLSRATIYRARAWALEAGELEISTEGGGRGITTRYVTGPALASMIDDVKPSRNRLSLVRPPVSRERPFGAAPTSTGVLDTNLPQPPESEISPEIEAEANRILGAEMARGKRIANPAAYKAAVIRNLLDSSPLSATDAREAEISRARSLGRNRAALTELAETIIEDLRAVYREDPELAEAAIAAFIKARGESRANAG